MAAGPNRDSRLVAVHLGHLNIHIYDVIVPGCGRYKRIYRLCAVARNFHLKAELFKNSAGDHLINFVVLTQKCPHILKRGRRFLDVCACMRGLCRILIKRQLNSEDAARVNRTVTGNGATHRRHIAFADGKPQAGTLDAAYLCILSPRKRLEQSRDLFRIDSHTAVLDDKTERRRF